MVSRAYEDAGYKRGTNGIKDLLKLLSGKGIIVKQDDAYIYKSEGFVNPSTEESKKV